MDTNKVEWQYELEESAHGVDLFRPPGDELQVEKARDQAEASGWIPTKEEPDSSASDRLSKAQLRRSELRRSMDELEKVCAHAAAAAGWIQSLDLAMRHVRVALGGHIFEVESPTGLLAEIVDVAPRLAPDVDSIKDEHRQLIESIDRVFDELLQGDEANHALLRTTALMLLGELALHRQHGSDLVYDAYNIDIAAGD